MIRPSVLLVLLFLSLTAADQEEGTCPPCENGSECVYIFDNEPLDGDYPYSFCNCETSPMLTAGNFCEYFASSVCNAVLGEFCTNDGVCIRNTFGYVPHHTLLFGHLRSSVDKRLTPCACLVLMLTLYIAIFGASVRRALKETVVSFSLKTSHAR
jgi:hypothetical protein